MKKVIEIKSQGKGYGKNWAKIVSRVDDNQKGGYCFEGKFIDIGMPIEVEEGSVIIHVEHRGSRANGIERCDVHIVTMEGLKPVIEAREWRHDFLEIRDKVKEALHQSGNNGNTEKE